jgi:cell division protein FtsX
MVRGPFLVEGALTGGAAGTIAAIVTLVVGVSVVGIGAANFAQVAPGLTGGVAFLAAVIVLLAGIGLGSGSSLLGVHRHLEN